MITAMARGASVVAAAIGVGAVLASFVAYRAATRADVRVSLLRKRFDSGELVSLAEATSLLDAAEREGPLDDAFCVASSSSSVRRSAS